MFRNAEELGSLANRMGITAARLLLQLAVEFISTANYEINYIYD